MHKNPSKNSLLLVSLNKLLQTGDHTLQPLWLEIPFYSLVLYLPLQKSKINGITTCTSNSCLQWMKTIWQAQQKNDNDGYLLGGCISFCSVFSLDLSSHCLEASGTNTPLQSKNDMVSIAPFNLNIVPEKLNTFTISYQH